ncbi:MAG TPA: response regulator transcription factor [Solirubrobacteraceae bacterium]|nr:response regulator transcription factor [Solirubrobacteraceae bacterium]
MPTPVPQPVLSRNGAGRGESTQTPIRCLVVDDHPAILAGLRGLLAGEPGVDVVAAVDNAEDALQRAEHEQLDVAIVDYQLPGHSGLWLSRKLKRLAHPPAVLIYSAFSDYMLAAACVVAEADGLLSKSALGSDLNAAVHRAADGLIRLPPVPPTLADGLRRRFDSLEQAIFGLLLAGIDRGEIARTLQIEAHEMETRQWTMLRKLERLD